MDMSCDKAIRTGALKIYMAIFGNYAPKIFNVDNPKQTLALSLHPDKRATQVSLNLKGVNPQGLVSAAELHRHYTRGVTVNGKNLDTYAAVAHILSRTLQIKPDEAERIIEEKYAAGWKEIYFITMYNSMNCQSQEGDTWTTYAGEIPTEDQRLKRLNQLLKAKGSNYRALTSSTYVTKVVGA